MGMWLKRYVMYCDHSVIRHMMSNIWHADELYPQDSRSNEKGWQPLQVHIQIPPTSYAGLIWCSTTEATALWSTVEGTLKVCCSYCDRSTMHVAAAAYPRSTLNSSLTCISPSGTASYETYVYWRNLDV